MDKTKLEFQTGKALSISGAHFVHDLFSSFLAPFLPLLINKFGLSMALAGSFTVFVRIPSVLNPLFGIISDRVNICCLAIWAPALTAVTMSLLGVAQSYAMVCVLLLIAGTSAAVFHVIGPVMIARVSGVNLGRGMSFWQTGGELARTVGPLLAVWAVSMWGFDGSYPVMIAGILASIFLYIKLKDVIPVIGPVQQHKNGNLLEIWRSLRRVMIPLAGIMISSAFMGGTLTAFLPTYLVAAGKSLWFGGASLAVLELSGAMGALLGGTISDRIGRHAVLLIAIPTSSILMLALIYAPEWAALPILAFLGCSLFASTPVKLAIVQDNSKNCRGAANGLYMGISFLITASVTVFVGWMADILGLRMAFTVSALLGLVGTPIVFFLPKNKKQAGC